jgi:hypothetical protein
MTDRQNTSPYTLDNILNELQDPRKEAILAFHKEFRVKIYDSKGSSHNHQNWEGGYASHIADACQIAKVLYVSLTRCFSEVPVSIDSAIIVLYFHDIEKIWKYTDGTFIDKIEWYEKILPERGITFSPEELNALRYTHGEGDDYRKDARVMNELAALCHAADNLSARIWHSKR